MSPSAADGVVDVSVTDAGVGISGRPIRLKYSVTKSPTASKQHASFVGTFEDADVRNVYGLSDKKRHHAASLLKVFKTKSL